MAAVDELRVGVSQNPRKWRFTWEAQCHIPTLRLFLFDSHTNPSSQCNNLCVELNLERSALSVSWVEHVRVSLRVPIPRVLVDSEVPLSFRALEDHIEVKLVLVLPVDHPIIVSGFDSLLNSFGDGDTSSPASDEAAQPLSMDYDLKCLSSKEGVHFYCKNCSAKLTRKPIRSFLEMPSVNWREVADNWFGNCCCSFGGISEKLVIKYADLYNCKEGTCLLNITSVVVCGSDLWGCKFTVLDRIQKYDTATYMPDANGPAKASPNCGMVHERAVCCENRSTKMLDVNGKLSFVHHKERLPGNPVYEGTGKDVNIDDLTGNVVSTTGCCIDKTHYDNKICVQYGSELFLKEGDTVECTELLGNQKSFLDGFLGNIFMVKSSNISKDVEWIEFICPQCSFLLGAYPCVNGGIPLDDGVRLFKCNISTCVPAGGLGDVFRKYTLEKMFANQLYENARDELSFKTVISDLKTKSPLIQVVLLNANYWCCSGYCLCTEDTADSHSKINMHPIIKVLFSESQLSLMEEWVTKNMADEVYMFGHQIKEMIAFLNSARELYPPSIVFLQGLSVSHIRR